MSDVRTMTEEAGAMATSRAPWNQREGSLGNTSDPNQGTLPIPP